MDKHDEQAGGASEDHYNELDLPPELRQVAQRYAAQPVPRPRLQAVQRLMPRLLMEATVISRAGDSSRSSTGHTLRMTRWQLHLLGPWFWITGVLLLLLGLLVAPVLKSGTITMLVILAPLTALLGVIYALRQLKSGIREVEASCPTSIVEVFAGLALAIVCFDVVLGLMATIGLTLAQWAPFTPLLATWLGPLLLLVGISFPVALRWGTIPAMVVGGGPWLVVVGISMLFPGSLPSRLLMVQQDSVAVAAHVIVAGLGMLILLLLLWYGSKWQRVLVVQGP